MPVIMNEDVRSISSIEQLQALRDSIESNPDYQLICGTFTHILKARIKMKEIDDRISELRAQ